MPPKTSIRSADPTCWWFPRSIFAGQKEEVGLEEAGECRPCATWRGSSGLARGGSAALKTGYRTVAERWPGSGTVQLLFCTFICWGGKGAETASRARLPTTFVS